MAIYLEIEPTTEDLTGKSHWWGEPDLPEGMSYPYGECVDYDENGKRVKFSDPLYFLCQIRCRDIARHDPANLLPHKGMLYFFMPKMEYFLGNYDACYDQQPELKIIYSPEEKQLVTHHVVWEGDQEGPFLPAEKISFDFTDVTNGFDFGMLCLPAHEEIECANPNEVVLLQIEEEDRWNLRIHDCGTIYVLIPIDDLLARRWDKAHLEVFTY